MNNQNNSNNKTIISVIVLLALVVGVTTYWHVQNLRTAARNQAAQVLQSQQNANKPKPEPQIITALHQFTKGKHIIAGEVDLPTPCHVLNQDVTINSGVTPEQINIAFVTTTKDESLCAQVLTSTRYKIDFIASENAVITATWNGEPAQLNLVPVAAGENLEIFDELMKG